jgi:hypothetical protein
MPSDDHERIERVLPGPARPRRYRGRHRYQQGAWSSAAILSSMATVLRKAGQTGPERAQIHGSVLPEGAQDAAP